MVGRISTAEIYRTSISSVADAQQLLNRTQEQLGTGRAILQPSDDPVASAQIQGLRTDLERLEVLQINTNRADATLAFEDQALAGTEIVLNRARELALQANSAVLRPEDRATIATEIDGLLQQLLSLGNTQSADGEFIFAGFESKETPFVLNTGTPDTVTYEGDNGVRELNIAPGITLPINTPGSEIFFAAPGNGDYEVKANTANTGTGVVGRTTANATFDDTQDYQLNFIQLAPDDPITWEVVDAGGAGAVIASGTYAEGDPIAFGGAEVFVKGAPANGDSFDVLSTNTGAPPARTQSAFDVLIELRDALIRSAESGAALAQADTVINQSIQSLDQNLAQISLVRTDVGVRLNRVEDQANLNEAFNIQLERTLGELEGLDYAEAISELELQLVALQAAQQTFVKTTGLTLFNFL